MIGIVGMGDVNRRPRRWTDRSARVRVVEGWHPSQPDRLGYNLVVDGDWIGTFETIDGAADAAGKHVQSRGVHVKGHKVVLLPYLHP